MAPLFLKAQVLPILPRPSMCRSSPAVLQSLPRPELLRLPPVTAIREPPHTASVPLPVSQVKITPGFWEIFKNETKVFSAKAYKSYGSELTGKIIKRSIRTTDTTRTGPAASIDLNGKFMAIRVGEASVFAEVEGFISRPKFSISPEFAFVILPLMSSLNPGEL